MSEDTNLDDVKKAQEEKIRAAFSGDEAMVGYMTATLESFAHRYLSSQLDPRPLPSHQGDTLTVLGRENSMVNALKVSDASVQEGIKDLARRVPRAQSPTVLSRLTISWRDLRPDRGALSVEAEINWGFPDHRRDDEQKLLKRHEFTWNDLGEFRKGLPLLLERACELFL